MSDIVHILRDPGTRRWVKCILGLDELGIAILPHIKDVFQKYYNKHFWDYHHLGCKLDCQHDHSYHIGCAPVGIFLSVAEISKCRNDHKCRNQQGCPCWQSPEQFAEWKLSGRSSCCSCYQYWPLDEVKCRNSSCPFQEYFNELVRRHENMHGEDFWYRVKKRHGHFVLETKPDCTACKSAFELLKKSVIDPDSGKINWRNFNFPEDFRDSWKLAKAFMPSGNSNTDDPTKVDTVALLTVMNNCSLFDVETALIDKIISMRNVFVHIGSQKASIETEQTDEFFELIIRFLTGLKKVYDCQENIATIEKIKESEVTAEMFTKANAIHVQCLLNTLSDYDSAGKDISEVECAIKDKVEGEKYLKQDQGSQTVLQLELPRQKRVNSDQLKMIYAKNVMIDNLQAEILKLKQETVALKKGLARKERVNSRQKKMINARNITIDNIRTEISKLEQDKNFL